MKDKLLNSLGVTQKGKKILLFYSLSSDDKTIFRVEASSNGFDFFPERLSPKIIAEEEKEGDIGSCREFRISQIETDNYFLIYKEVSKDKVSLSGATSEDLIHWQKVGNLPSLKNTSMVVPGFNYQGKYVLYFGGDKIKTAFSSDLKKWRVSPKPISGLQSKSSKKLLLKVGSLELVKEGILLIYYERMVKNGSADYSVKTAIFGRKNPNLLLWKGEKPIWRQGSLWRDKEIFPVGIVRLDGKLFSYWEVAGEGIYAIQHSPLEAKIDSKPMVFTPLLKKFSQNPILKPIFDHFWESQYVFNPAAVYEKGKVHLVYRAVGDSAISVLGYASSVDGIHFDQRLKEPIYVPKEPFEVNLQAPLCATALMSGGGAGGCEDPRLTKIDGRIYMTYVAWDGAINPRVAITSVDADDFVNHRFKWAKSVPISAPHIIDKNACIMPEKVKGKYVIFHRIFPNILIDFVDSLDFDGQTFLKGEYQIKIREKCWDSRKVAVGPPPIKTDDGWLLIYHAVCDWGPYYYKMGAMILDLEDPTRVLYRSKDPILEPTEKYEFEGYKPGISYPCGAAAINDNLFVYYGGADTFVCVAMARLSQFLDQLKKSESAQLTPVNLQAFRQIPLQYD